MGHKAISWYARQEILFLKVQGKQGGSFTFLISCLESLGPQCYFLNCKKSKVVVLLVYFLACQGWRVERYLYICGFSLAKSGVKKKVESGSN